FLLGKSCDGECKARLVEILLPDLSSSGGAFDHALAALLERARVDATLAVGRLHARLLWCQIDGDSAAHLRDHVLVPVAAAAANALTRAPAATADGTRAADGRLQAALGLLALGHEPAANTPERAAWDAF